MKIKLNTTKAIAQDAVPSSIAFNPTRTELDLGAVEETPDGKIINVTVIQIEDTEFGYRQQVEFKKYPASLQSIITGLDLENGGEPIINKAALQAVFDAHGITIND